MDNCKGTPLLVRFNEYWDDPFSEAITRAANSTFGCCFIGIYAIMWIFHFRGWYMITNNN